MRVLHINCNYVGTTLHQLMVEKLDSLGIDNKVFVPVYSRDVAVIQPNQNVVVSECFNRRDRYVFDYKQAKILRALEAHVPVGSCELIHAYTLFTDGNCARRLSKTYGIPYVVAVRNTDVNDFFGKRIALRRRGVEILRDAARVFFLSEAYRRTVLERYVPAALREEIRRKSLLMPNGIDEFWFERQNDSPLPLGDPLRLLYVGTVDRNKNITGTQAAMKRLAAEGMDCRLTVVGKIKDPRVFAQISRDSRTSYREALPKERLLELYRQNHIFVMPSIHETFGLVYAEALSQGLPVIYSRGQGFDEQFEDGLVGRAVEARSPDSIAEGIRHVAEHYPTIQARCAEKAQRFRWDTICREYARLYGELIG